MAEKQTRPNDQDARSGTQVGGVPGGTNSISATGASQNDRGPADPERHGTRTDSRDDPEAIFEGSRHQSQSVAKQFARDEADADTQARTPHGAGEPRHHQIFPTEKKE